MGNLSVSSHTITVRFWGTGDCQGIEAQRNLYIKEIEE